MVKDHLGNEYKSYTELGKKYGLSKSAITRRLRKGYTLEETLTIPSYKATKKHQVYDHLGNKFSSLTAMIKYYNISYETLSKRLKDNWELEKALTTPTTKLHEKSYIPNKLYDHLGNEYKTVYDLCTTYGISVNTYYKRLSYKWPLNELLTTTSNEHAHACDHLGNKFKSIIKMCEHYNIDRTTFEKRIRNNWTLEKTLTTPAIEKTTCYDHLGNTFKSKRKLCEHYGIDRTTFEKRIGNNWTLEKALTTPSNEIIQYDHLGNMFESKTKLCKHYGITTKRFNYFKDKDYSIEECLNIIPKINAKLTNHKISDTFIIKKCITKTDRKALAPNLYFLCSHDNIDLIMSRDAIINYYRQNILKTA